MIESKETILRKTNESFSKGEDVVLRHHGILRVPDVDGLRELTMEVAHGSRYSIHPGATKMYHDIQETYWWNGMKRDIINFVGKSSNCQQVKEEHQRPGGFTQNIDIPTWKWKDIKMDFVVWLLRYRRKYDSIWVIVDRLTNSAYFLPVKVTYSQKIMPNCTLKRKRSYMDPLKSIILERGTQFTSHS